MNDMRSFFATLQVVLVDKRHATMQLLEVSRYAAKLLAVSRARWESRLHGGVLERGALAVDSSATTMLGTWWAL